MARSWTLEALAEGIRAGDRRAVARAITLIESRDPLAYELVRESFFRANQEHKLSAVAEPRVEEAAPIKKGQPFTFAAIIEVRGDFNGKVLSLRSDDLKALCTLVGGDIPTGVAQLRSWGVMIDGPEIPESPWQL